MEKSLNQSNVIIPSDSHQNSKHKQYVVIANLVPVFKHSNSPLFFPTCLAKGILDFFMGENFSIFGILAMVIFFFFFFSSTCTSLWH